MARSFRRRRMSGRKKRPVDWVVQPEMYGLSAYELTPTVVGGIGFEAFEMPLTAHEDFGAAGDFISGTDQVWSARRFPHLEQTAVRIKGCIHAWLSPAEAWWENRNGHCWLKLRIRKTSQQLQDVTPQFNNPAFNDVGASAGASFANEDYLWEDHHVWIASSTWGDVDVGSMVGPVKFDVDVKTQRRLRVGEQLALYMAVYSEETFGLGPGTWPGVAIKPQLRTLMRTIT